MRPAQLLPGLPGQDRTASSCRPCGTKVAPGMVVESETEEVHEARRTALELLFSDHVGDCLSPCHRLCPLQLNIPVMLRHIEAERLDEAIATVRQALPLAGSAGAALSSSVRAGLPARELGLPGGHSRHGTVCRRIRISEAPSRTGSAAQTRHRQKRGRSSAPGRRDWRRRIIWRAKATRSPWWIARRRRAAPCAMWRSSSLPAAVLDAETGVARAAGS